MTPGEQEKAAFQSVYDLGRQDALRTAWQAVNVLGAPQTACTTDTDRAYCRAIDGALDAIEKLQMPRLRRMADERIARSRENLAKPNNGL